MIARDPKANDSGLGEETLRPDQNMTTSASEINRETLMKKARELYKLLGRFEITKKFKKDECTVFENIATFPHPNSEGSKDLWTVVIDNDGIYIQGKFNIIQYAVFTTKFFENTPGYKNGPSLEDTYLVFSEMCMQLEERIATQQKYGSEFIHACYLEYQATKKSSEHDDVRVLLPISAIAINPYEMLYEPLAKVIREGKKIAPITEIAEADFVPVVAKAIKARFPEYSSTGNERSWDELYQCGGMGEWSTFPEQYAAREDGVIYLSDLRGKGIDHGYEAVRYRIAIMAEYENEEEDIGPFTFYFLMHEIVDVNLFQDLRLHILALDI